MLIAAAILVAGLLLNRDPRLFSQLSADELRNVRYFPYRFLLGQTNQEHVVPNVWQTEALSCMLSQGHRNSRMISEAIEHGARIRTVSKGHDQRYAATPRPRPRLAPVPGTATSPVGGWAVAAAVAWEPAPRRCGPHGDRRTGRPRMAQWSWLGDHGLPFIRKTEADPFLFRGHVFKAGRDPAGAITQGSGA